MREQPLVSVIVPVYKVEPYLDRCVQSIVDQTYTNLQIILVDDGSPDSCPQMCDEWAKKDSRICVIHKDNGGLSDARNAGMAVAKGEYIAFVDSDDWLEKDFLLLLYQALKSAQADIAECGVLLCDEKGNMLRCRASEEEQLTLEKIEALRRLVLEDGVYQTVWNKLYRRSVIGNVRFETDRVHEDEFWTYRVFENSGKVAVLNRPLYRYLQRTGSIMGVGYSLKRLDGLEARMRRMQDLQQYPELAELTRQQMVMDCMYHWQSACRHLAGGERRLAIGKIKEILRQTTPVRWKHLTLRPVYKLWYVLFRRMPGIVAKIRNNLRIGVG